MRILLKWYFNELLGYLIMSVTSIPVIAYNLNKSEFFSIEMIIYVETATERNKTILSSNHMILTKLYVGNVYNRA